MANEECLLDDWMADCPGQTPQGGEAHFLQKERLTMRRKQETMCRLRYMPWSSTLWAWISERRWVCFVGWESCWWQRVEAYLSNFLTGILEGERPLLRMALGQIRGGLSELRRPREMVREGQECTLEPLSVLGWWREPSSLALHTPQGGHGSSKSHRPAGGCHGEGQLTEAEAVRKTGLGWDGPWAKGPAGMDAALRAKGKWTTSLSTAGSNADAQGMPWRGHRPHLSRQQPGHVWGPARGLPPNTPGHVSSAVYIPRCHFTKESEEEEQWPLRVTQAEAKLAQRGWVLTSQD